MPEELKEISSEEEENQKGNSVYDFLYCDHERVFCIFHN